MLLVSMMTLGLFAGCGQQSQGQTQVFIEEKPTERKEVAADAKVPAGIDEFNTQLISFIDGTKLAEDNYMISPTSFKAALCLAVAGADGQTKDELLKAMGFESEEQMNAWYNLVYNSTVDFQEWLDYAKEEGDVDGAYKIVNSIWANEDYDMLFKDEYIKKMEKDYSAAAASRSAAELTDAVNKWVDESTNGQIKDLGKDLAKYKFILANALYLRASWMNSFDEGSIKIDAFTTADGSTEKKEYMQQTEKFYYYEEDGGKLVVLPLNGGINAAFVLGNITDINKALTDGEYVDVDVKLPKMEIETSLSDGELIGFLESKGVSEAFSDNADFSRMTDSSVLIDDIIQKTKIKTDEEGLEASAVTAIMMTEAAMEPQEDPIIKEFYATEPFKFFIYTPLENYEKEILFYGQMIK